MTDRDPKNDDRVDIYGNPIRRTPGDWHPGDVQARWNNNRPFEDRTDRRPVEARDEERVRRSPETRGVQSDRNGPVRPIPMSEVGEHFGRGPRGYQRSDAHIHEDVGQALADDGDLDASRIELSVHDAEVTLAGQVERRADKRRAEDLAGDVRGVHDVHNRLRVDPTS